MRQLLTMNNSDSSSNSSSIKLIELTKMKRNKIIWIINSNKFNRNHRYPMKPSKLNSQNRIQILFK
jgi:hypothetical protein